MLPGTIAAELIYTDECPHCLPAELTNDHKALTKAMDQLLQQLHATQKPQNGHAQPHISESSRPAQRSEAMTEPAAHSASQLAHSRPFAKIDQVSEHSPASTAGLQVICSPLCGVCLACKLKQGIMTLTMCSHPATSHVYCKGRRCTLPLGDHDTHGVQVGDLLVGIGDVFSADSSPQEAMAQVASIVRVALALKASHGCQDKVPARKDCQGPLDSSWAAQVPGRHVDMPSAASHCIALAMSTQRWDSVTCRGAEMWSSCFWYSGEVWK